MKTRFRRKSDEVRERGYDDVWIIVNAALWSWWYQRNKNERRKAKQKYYRRLVDDQDRKLFLLLIGEHSLDDASPELRRRYKIAMRYAAAERALGKKIRKQVKLGRAVSRVTRMMK